MVRMTSTQRLYEQKTLVFFRQVHYVNFIRNI